MNSARFWLVLPAMLPPLMLSACASSTSRSTLPTATLSVSVPAPLRDCPRLTPLTADRPDGGASTRALIETATRNAAASRACADLPAFYRAAWPAGSAPSTPEPHP